MIFYCIDFFQIFLGKIVSNFIIIIVFNFIQWSFQ